MQMTKTEKKEQDKTLSEVETENKEQKETSPERHILD